jgi:hypothetical protein
MEWSTPTSAKADNWRLLSETLAKNYAYSVGTILGIEYSNFIIMAGLSAAPRARCLCLDIETARQDRLVLREIGAFRPDLDARLKLSGNAPDLSARLDALTQDAAFVLGHNVIAFDQPALAVLHPALALHRLR